MTTTVNISLPKEMYKDAKRAVKEKRYSSISELVRDALRKTIYSEDQITENGFPRWLEEKVIKASKSPREDDIVLETNEDVDKFFKKLHQEIESERHSKSS